MTEALEDGDTDRATELREVLETKMNDAGMEYTFD